MSKLERRAKILEILNRDNTVYLSALTKMFPNVSAMTIRRDLDYFELSGVAERIYGGAQKKTEREPYYSFRASENTEAKKKIAKACIPYIRDGSSIYIDCGTTAMQLAIMLKDRKINVITSGPNIGMELSSRLSMNIIILGGILNYDNISVSGGYAEEMLNKFNLDTAFIVASGYTDSGGFSCGNYNEGELKKKALSKAANKIMLIDSTKFGRNLMYTFATVNEIDAVITDYGAEIKSDELKSKIKIVS